MELAGAETGLADCLPIDGYQVPMLARLAWVLLAAAGTLSSALAADLVEVAPTVCDCGSDMITIYDFEPGVVTRHWNTNGECRYAPYARMSSKVAAPDEQLFADPWRRW